EHEASRLLAAHRDLLDSMAARLVVDETLEGDELHKILSSVVPLEPASGNGLAPRLAGGAGSVSSPANKKRREE
ncbi:MAG TPA: hypothetical protein VG408_03750, partial [Actinomycetota bacterium]|nr:hypothetical protein [Actinomycetota bacterium]